MTYDFIQNHKRLSIIIIIILLTIPVIYYAYINIDRAGKVEVSIDAAPEDATITIDSRPSKPGTTFLKPGTYVIKASKSGFADYTTTQVIGEDQRTIAVLLKPVSEEAKQWAQKNQQKYLEVEGKVGQVSAEQGEAFRTKNPIVNLLPYKNYLFTIGYKNDNSDASGNSIIVTINAPEAYRDSAIYQIYQWGYDPTDFKIEFTNFNNPFAS
jgi:hypothetical protein